MTTPIIPDIEPTHKTQADLICPAAGCRALCCFSSARLQVYCPTCGWRHDLTYTQHAELVDALLGISDLAIANFLQNLHVPDPPPPPSAGGFPATLLIGGPRAGRRTGHRALVGVYTARAAHKAPVPAGEPAPVQQALEGAAAIAPPAPLAARPPGPPVGRKARTGRRRNPSPPQPSDA